MTSILVTGGAGSMGRLVCGQLASEGHTIRAFDLSTAVEEAADRAHVLEHGFGDGAGPFEHVGIGSEARDPLHV